MNDCGIERVPVAETEMPTLSGELFEKAKELLDYDSNATISFERDGAALKTILAKADIAPLKLSQVNRYKRWQYFKANKIWLRVPAHLSVIAGIFWAMYHSLQPKDAADWAMCCFVTFMLAGLGGAGAIWSHSWYEWDDTRLSGYDRPVPEFALSYALAIKQQNPYVQFRVEELKGRERVLDPFLTVIFGDATYYIAVWDEPKFEGRKT